MKIKHFEPNFRTEEKDFNREELNKAASGGLRGTLFEDFRDKKPDVEWESEQLAKSYGIYLGFNRARTGREKDWVYMVRVSIPGGGPVDGRQWRQLDALSEKFTAHSGKAPSLRITTRQNLQFHWVKKEHILEIVKHLAENGLFTLNGCGDNVRNIMACPLAASSGVLNGNELATRLAGYFRLPAAPFIQIFAVDPKFIREEGKTYHYGGQILNRKFKIGISSFTRDTETGLWAPDNCVELRTHDLGIAPLRGGDDNLEGFQIYLGGGQGEKNGKPTFSTLAEPFGKVSEADLLRVLDAVVKVQQEWGDRQNRHWARLKYIIKGMGIRWYRREVEAISGVRLEDPDPDHDIGRRMLHHGWQNHPDPTRTHLGVFIENGRITDESPNGRLKSMIRFIMEKYPVRIMFTPNQDLIFTDLPAAAKGELQTDLETFGYGARADKPYSRLRKLSGACVGLDTCRMAYTDSEKIEPLIIDQLEALGWGEMAESIGITGCERQCFRPATKTIGLIGSGRNTYQFKLLGSENGAFQGEPLLSADGREVYLRKVPREDVITVIDVLFRFYRKRGFDGEDMGAFHRRIGREGIIRHLRENPRTTALMKSEAVRTSMERKKKEPLTCAAASR